MQIANIYVHFTSLLWKRVGGRQCPTGDMGCYWLSSESSEFPTTIPRAIRFFKGPISPKRRIKCLVWGVPGGPHASIRRFGLFGPLSSPPLTSHLPRLQSAGEGEKPRGRTIAPPALSPPRHSMEMAGLDIFTAPSLFNLTWKVHRHSTTLHSTLDIGIRTQRWLRIKEITIFWFPSLCLSLKKEM